MSKTPEYTWIERCAMSHLLNGAHQVLEVLRRQFSTSKCVRRELTRVGFFTYIDVVERDCEVHTLFPIRRHFVLRESAHLDRRTLVGFLLFVDDGVIDCLEGYTFSHEDWPGEVGSLDFENEGDDAQRLRLYEDWWTPTESSGESGSSHG